MFHIVDEVGKLKPGFNFYPWTDRYSFGVRILFNKHRMIGIRWSKQNKNFHIWKYWLSKKKHRENIETIKSWG